MDDLNYGAETAKRKQPLLEAQRVLVDKAKIPNKPLSEQLDAKDAQRFTEISEQMKSADVFDLLQSKRNRDIMFIADAAELAGAVRKGMPEPAGDSDPQYLHFAILTVTRLMREDTRFTPTPPSETCTIKQALQAEQNEGFGRVNAIDMSKMTKDFGTWSAKYKMDKIDPSKLSQAEARTYANHWIVLSKAKMESDFVKDMENLKLLDEASEIRYEYAKLDFQRTRDISAIGESIDKANLPQSILGMMVFLAKIDERVPSRWTQNAKELSDLFDKLDIK